LFQCRLDELGGTIHDALNALERARAALAAAHVPDLVYAAGAPPSAPASTRGAATTTSVRW